jgi:subtilisin family serine protease
LTHVGDTRRYSLPAVTAGGEAKGVWVVVAVRVELGLDAADPPCPTGRGTLIGIVDTAFDAGHPSLEQAVVRAWDQQDRYGGEPSAKGYGVEFADITLSELQDESGHGTHVAAIAAGRGAPQGIAPGADVALVAYDGTDLGLLAAIEWIFALAAERDQPCVINVSQGGVHADPHDGSDPVSMAIDEKCGPGRLVVAAAGNEGALSMHLQRSLEPSKAARLPFVCDFGTLESAELALWINEGTVQEVRVVDSEGRPVAVASPQEENVSGATRSERVAISVDTVRGNIAVVVERADAQSHTALLALELVAGGQGLDFHGWGVERNALWIDHGDSDLPAIGDGAYMVASPACARSVISVGAVYHAFGWYDPEGSLNQQVQNAGQLAPFSNRGPARDGRPKPEVCAAGVDIRSAQARQAPTTRVDFGGLKVESGTSMAAPIVAGLLACALERFPRLDPDGARALLREAGGESWDSGLGFGAVAGTKFVECLQR